MVGDIADVARDCGLARSAQQALAARLEALVGADQLDLRAPSRLPNWTRAHVVTHLARNADSHARMIEGAGRGEVLEQYAGGVQGRIDEIEEGVERSERAILADFAQSTAALEAAWSRTDWVGFGRRTLAGETPIADLPFARAREVALHSVDLDIGIDLADLDAMYVRLELTRMVMLWRARQPMGLTPVPPAALALSPSDRLGWFAGRLTVEGLAPAGIF